MFNLKKLFKIITQKQKKYLFFFIFGALIISILEIFSISLIIPISSYAANLENDLIKENFGYSFIKNFFIGYSNDVILKKLLIIFSIIYFFKIFISILIIFLLQKYNLLTTTSLTRRLFEIYLNQPFLFLKLASFAKISRNLTLESLSFSSYLSSLIVFYSEIIIIFCILIFLFLLNFFTTLKVLLFISVIILFYLLYFKRRITKWGEGKLKNRHDLIKYLEDGLKAIREVKLLSLEKDFVNNFYNSIRSAFTFDMKINMTQYYPRYLIELFIMGILLFYTYNNSSSQFINNIPLLAAYLLIALRLLPSCSRLLTVYQNMRFSYPSILLFEKEFQLADKINHISNFRSSNKTFNFKNLELQNVSFYYEKDKQIIRDLNLKIDKGDKVLLEGSSGSGKSTLMDIFAGLTNATSGKIILNNDLNLNLMKENWYGILGYVGQNNYFINDSILKNVAFGMPSKKIDEEKILDIFEQLGQSDLINNFEYKLNTTIGEMGSILSGGQLQRIALARALYNDPQILILDEAISALDILNQEKIINYLNKSGNTIIFSAHNLNNFKYSKKILLLDNANNKLV
jgi:ATP-binding cassette, subfamily B, bacterial PglK